MIRGTALNVSLMLALAALGRGIEMIGKFGVARPAQEVALTPLRDATRQRWKVLLRGVFNQGGAVAGGLLLIAATSVLEIDLAIAPACIAALALVLVLEPCFLGDLRGLALELLVFYRHLLVLRREVIERPALLPELVHGVAEFLLHRLEPRGLALGELPPEPPPREPSRR